MDNLTRLLLRLILVPLGYFAAVIAGAAVILIGEWRIGTLLEAPSGSGDGMVGFVVAIVVASTVLVVLVSLMWLVAAVGILFSEAFAVRSWMFHVANGVVSAFIGAQLFAGDTDVPPVASDPFYVIAAGLAAGLAYWLVAGSSAGFFMPILRSPAERARQTRPPPAPAEALPAAPQSPAQPPAQLPPHP